MAKKSGKENLIPFDKLTQEEQRKIAREGGIASGKSRSARKRFEEKIDVLFRVMTRVKVEEIKKMIKEKSVSEDERRILEAALEIVEEGGAEMMLVMETLTSKKASFANKMMTLFDLFEHRYGKAKQFTELTGADGAPLERPIIEVHTVKSKEKSPLDDLEDKKGAKDVSKNQD